MQQHLLVVLLAETTAAAGNVLTDKWGPLINLGAIGVVLFWFLWKTEPRLRRIEDAIDANSRTVLIAVMAMESVPDFVKTQAAEQLKKLDVVQAAQNVKS